MNSRLLAIVAAVVSVLGSPSGAFANYSSTGGSDYAVVGMVGTQAVICMSTGGTETSAVLGGSSGLSASVALDMLGGADTVIMVRTSGYNPGSAHDCGNSSWNPLLYNGFAFDIYGNTGNDNLQGGTGNTWVSGDDDNDYVYGFSSIGYIYGEFGDDQVLSLSSGGSDGLFGGYGIDCLTDSSNTVTGPGYFDCQVGSDNYTSSNSSIQSNCENAVGCCGIC